MTGVQTCALPILRDAYVVIFLGFFLVVTNFLYSETIPTGLYMLVVVAGGSKLSEDQPIKAERRK